MFQIGVFKNQHTQMFIQNLYKVKADALVKLKIFLKQSTRNLVKNNRKVLLLLKKTHFFKDVKSFFKIK